MTVKESGEDSNISADAELTVASTFSSGIDSTMKVTSDGIIGGVKGETDEEYLALIMTTLRNTTRYGDFAACVLQERGEKNEIPSFDIFYSFLIEVIHGNQIDGMEQVDSIQVAQSYIEQYSQKIIFTVDA